MPRIVASIAPSNFVGVSGKLWWVRPVGDFSDLGSSEMREIGFPAGTTAIARRPSWASYPFLGRNRQYGVGAWSANVLIDEHFRFLRQGIPSPTTPPAVSGTGSGSLTGTFTCYLRFRDNLGGRVGRLSAGTPVTTTNAAGRQWASLPTSCIDPSVSHVELLVSEFGALPRVAATRQLGTASVIEGVGTSSLGEAAPEDFTDMPVGTFNVVYHDRQGIGGNEQHPERLFLSVLSELERYSGLYLTSDGETIVGAFADNEELVYGSTRKIYSATGFADGDYAPRTEKADIGLVGHFGNTQVHGRTLVPTTIGVYLRDGGGWHFLMQDCVEEWAFEYKRYRDDYEKAYGFFDPEANVYLFGPVRHSRLKNLLGHDAWTFWVLNCKHLFPEGPGGEFAADWAHDVRQRKEESRAAIVLPGSARPEIVSGHSDGFLRKENVDSDTNDDGDDYGKRVIIEPPSILPDPGGKDTRGQKYVQMHTFIASPEDAWTLEVRGGTEKARLRLEPDYAEEVDPTGVPDDYSEPRSTHIHPLELVVGDAMNMAIVADSPKSLVFRGFGVTFAPGIKSLGADARGLGPGQVVDLDTDPDGGVRPVDSGACGNADPDVAGEAYALWVTTGGGLAGSGVVIT